jgi:hypothetical protein
VSENIALEKAASRWYKLDPVEEQMKLVADRTRFIIVAAGRRSGKTERAKRRILKACMDAPGNYFIAAPTYSQVKMIYWDDIKEMGAITQPVKDPSESKLIYYFNNGAKLYLLGLDKPKRIEGVLWKGGIIDECAYIKESAWVNSVRPALDTKDRRNPGYKAWCWLIGKPDGRNHFYDWFKYAKIGTDPEWAAYHWESAVVLDKDTLDAAMRSMSPKQFNQEYRATFETSSGRIYEDYGPKNYTDELITADEEIHYYCDFNFTPMSHGIAVIRGIDVLVLDEIVLEGAKGYMNVIEFCERYKDHRKKVVYLYGDSSGSNGAKHGLDSEYSLMVTEFKKYGWAVTKRVKAANPAIKDRHNAVNAKILNAAGEVSLFVNPTMAPYNDKSLDTTQFKKGSTVIEEQSTKDHKEYQHMSTGLGYFLDRVFPAKGKFDFDAHQISNPWGID